MTEIRSGMIQFDGDKGQGITTPLATLTVIRGKDDYKAFFGYGGKANITEQTHNQILLALGMNVPPKAKASDDDADFTLPN